MKPSLFIASSSIRLELAYAAQQELEPAVEPTVWTQGAFALSKSTMENLLGAVSGSDFGLFIFAPDDVTSIRGLSEPSVGDNVVFELGLFVGRLGPRRSFIIAPSRTELHLPTDLLGITPARYEPDRKDGNMRAALGTACSQVRQAVRRLGAVAADAAAIASKPGGGDGSIIDTGDDKALLQSWMGSRTVEANTSAIKFAEVDRELGLTPGSAKEHLAKVAERWSYKVAQTGAQTVLFQRAGHDGY